MKLRYFSKQFEDFFINRMTGEELEIFDVRAGLFSKLPPRDGLFRDDVVGRPGTRTVRFTFYYSRKLKELFAVGAHLLRRGEPKEWDQQQMDEYMEAIQAWEAHPGSKPEAFGLDEED
jgi:hypothetical protein